MRIEWVGRWVFACIFLGLHNLTYGQNSAVRRADSFYEEKVYNKAFLNYQKAWAKDSSDVAVLRKMADVAFRIGENKLALKYYARLIKSKATVSKDYLNYAKALKRDGDYKASTYWLMYYSEIGDLSGEGEQLEFQLMDIMALFRDSASMDVKPLPVNTPESDLGPFVYGDKLVFCSAGRQDVGARRSYLDDMPYLKLYEIDILGNHDFSAPAEFAPQLASRFHDGPAAIASSPNRMFVTTNQDRHTRKKVNAERFVPLKIKQAELWAGEWVYVADFPYTNKEYSIAHPAVNTDGTVLIFASNMPGGYGKTDLYRSRFENGRWTIPVNLGPGINTAEDELFPYLAADGGLYFSSNGHGGLGGLDIFRGSMNEEEQFGGIRNLGYPINSAGDDFGFTLYRDETSGFFSSNRKGGKGRDDLYSFHKVDLAQPVRLLVNDEGSSRPLGDANLVVVDMAGDTVAAAVTGDNGVAMAELVPEKAYSIRVNRQHYFESRIEFVPGKVGDETQEVAVEMYYNPGMQGDDDRPLYMDLEDGNPIQVMEVFSIHYDLAHWDIREQEFEQMQEILDYVDANPGSEIRIESHADSRGSREYNNVLSNKRALVANNYFVSHYIRPERIRYQGFGESRLLNICFDGTVCRENEHALNRRTVIKVVRKGAYYNMQIRRSGFYF